MRELIYIFTHMICIADLVSVVPDSKDFLISNHDIGICHTDNYSEYTYWTNSQSQWVKLYHDLAANGIFVPMFGVTNPRLLTISNNF